MTDVEIKALAYDLMASIENSQKGIQAINLELNKRAGAPKEVKTEEPK